MGNIQNIEFQAKAMNRDLGHILENAKAMQAEIDRLNKQWADAHKYEFRIKQFIPYEMKKLMGGLISPLDASGYTGSRKRATRLDIPLLEAAMFVDKQAYEDNCKIKVVNDLTLTGAVTMFETMGLQKEGWYYPPRSRTQKKGESGWLTELKQMVPSPYDAMDYDNLRGRVLDLIKDIKKNEQIE